MKIFAILFVLVSIIYGLNGRCIRHHPSDDCQEVVFPEPEPKKIEYVYYGNHGENCGCQNPEHHDARVEQPRIEEHREQLSNYEYGIDVPKKQLQKDEKFTRYMFDVRVEAPFVPVNNKPLESHSYNVQIPEVRSEQMKPITRYIFDGRVEAPVTPCEKKPWQGLVAQVDKVLMPRKECPKHKTKTCNCGNNGYTLPIIYRYDITNDQSPQVSRKIKREAVLDAPLKSKRRESKLKLKPLKKLKELKTSTLKPKTFPMISKKSKILSSRQLRHKRGPSSSMPCAYSYESCDPKKNNRDGCPSCYRCNCEPITKQRSDQKFSPYDLKVPYQVINQDDAPNVAASYQEYNNAPEAYTGLRDHDMYRSYIGHVINKYPEFLSRNMPNVQDQQQDLIQFIDQLSKSDKSPGNNYPNQPGRYKLADSAMDLYQFYERAKGKNAQISGDQKPYQKRGTVLEVIELDPNEFDGKTYKYKMQTEDFGDNLSASE